MGIITNIIKGVLGKLPIIKQSANRDLNWWNYKILKHQNNHTLKKIRISNFDFYYIRAYEFLHTYKDIFGKEIYKFDTANTEPVIIDCGSNIGQSILYFKLLYPRSRIIGFEPDSQNFQILEKNMVSNGFKDVQMENAAVWIKNGEISFTNAGSEASHIIEEKSENKAQVRCVRLVEILSDYDQIDFLKIDIEGAEYEVLKDCTPYLSRINNIFLEYHGYSNETKKISNIFRILTEKGFSTYVENAANNLKHPFINKTLNNFYDVQLNIYCYRN